MKSVFAFAHPFFIPQLRLTFFFHVLYLIGPYTQLRDIWLRIVDDNQNVLNKDVDHTAIVNGGHDGTGTLMETTVNTPGSPFLCGEDQRSAEKFGGTRIDAVAWLGRATLDVIGLAGQLYFHLSASVFEKNHSNDSLTIATSRIRLYVQFING